jgi:hypothetical protein
MSEVDSHSPLAAENAVTEERPHEGPSIGGAHQERATLENHVERRGVRARVSRSWERYVKCAFTRVVRWGLGSVARESLHASVALTSRVEGSAGVRVENRLQKSVRSIFLAAAEESREALFERSGGSVRR